MRSLPGVKTHHTDHAWRAWRCFPRRGEPSSARRARRADSGARHSRARHAMVTDVQCGGGPEFLCKNYIYKLYACHMHVCFSIENKKRLSRILGANWTLTWVGLPFPKMQKQRLAMSFSGV